MSAASDLQKLMCSIDTVFWGCATIHPKQLKNPRFLFWSQIMSHCARHWTSPARRLSARRSSHHLCVGVLSIHRRGRHSLSHGKFCCYCSMTPPTPSYPKRLVIFCQIHQKMVLKAPGDHLVVLNKKAHRFCIFRIIDLLIWLAILYWCIKGA